MKLPDAVEVSPALALEMARRNGLRAVLARPMPHQGMINTVIALDDQFVLKVPRAHTAHVDQANVEAQAIPLAVAAGVRTPRLLAYDTSLDLVPVPFLIVERVDGYHLGDPVWTRPPSSRCGWALDVTWRDCTRACRWKRGRPKAV